MCEADSALRQLVEVRRGEVLCSIAADIERPLVVGEDEDDVRLSSGEERSDAGQEKKGGKKMSANRGHASGS